MLLHSIYCVGALYMMEWGMESIGGIYHNGSRQPAFAMIFHYWCPVPPISAAKSSLAFSASLNNVLFLIIRLHYRHSSIYARLWRIKTRSCSLQCSLSSLCMWLMECILTKYPLSKDRILKVINPTLVHYMSHYMPMRHILCRDDTTQIPWQWLE